MLIHDNPLSNTGKPVGHNGDLVGAPEGFNKDIKFYNNICSKLVNDNVNILSGFNACIESWYDQGGWEVFNNTFNGGGTAIDVARGGANIGTYAYSWYVHDNIFQEYALVSTYPLTGTASMGVQFETMNPNGGDAIIINNHFKNTATAVQITLSHTSGEAMKRLYVNNNLMENMGYADGSFGGFIINLSNSKGIIDSVFIDNNTMIGGTTGYSRAGLYIEADAGAISTTNIYYRNNIIENISGYGYLTFRGTIASDHIFSQHNITFNNSHSNSPYYFSGTPTTTNLTNTENIISNPLLDGSFHLQGASPAIGAGLNVGHGTDIGYKRKN
jgi:hypothetical protein